MTRRWPLALLFALALFTTRAASAAQLTFAWDPNPESDIAGYIIEWGTAAAPFANSVEVGNATSWTLSNAAEGTTYIFRVSAYNAAGEISDPSAPITETIGSSTPPPPPAPRASNPMMSVDIPSANATLRAGAVFTVAGWAIDLGAAAGPGVNAVHIWAYPSSGAAPVFVGAAATGGLRPDVAGYVGGQFQPCGYSVSGTLPAGDYNMVVFAQSTVTGTFNNVVVIPVHVR